MMHKGYGRGFGPDSHIDYYCQLRSRHRCYGERCCADSQRFHRTSGDIDNTSRRSRNVDGGIDIVGRRECERQHCWFSALDEFDINRIDAKRCRRIEVLVDGDCGCLCLCRAVGPCDGERQRRRASSNGSTRGGISYGRCRRCFATKGQV